MLSSALKAVTATTAVSDDAAWVDYYSLLGHASRRTLEAYLPLILPEPLFFLD